MLRVVVLTLVTIVLADSSFSQGHIKYSDGSGTNVDWKLYAPYAQFKAQLQHYQRRDSAKSLSEQSPIIKPAVQAAVGIGAKSLEPKYKPFSDVPHHLKQLLSQSYESQAPYVDPEAFLHKIPQFSFGEVIPRKDQPLEQQSRSQSIITTPQGRRGLQQKQNLAGMEKLRIQPGRNQPQMPLMSHVQSVNFDKSVPLEIQQLLQYQAQIPYNVIANHIIYKPEAPFIPEPLLEDEVGPYKYRSRVYYAVKNNMRNKEVREHPVSENHMEE